MKQLTRSPDGLKVWSPNGQQYLLNRKDSQGTYQLYVGAKDEQPACITCSKQPDSPEVKRHKLQPAWHPSGKWIVLAGERDDYQKPFFATPDLIEGWVQSGIWVNIYVTRPDGAEWHRLTDFGHERGDGFTGVAFTSDGKRAVFARVVSGNILDSFFGRWELILANFEETPGGAPRLTDLKNITPKGVKWVEPGNFAPDDRQLVITADAGLTDQQGMDQFILNVDTGELRNLTNSPNVWDEHGIFSPDGEKILFMSSYPFQADRLSNSVLFLRTEFMLMNKDGSGLQQLTHFNSPGFPETNVRPQTSVAANGAWHPDGGSVSVLNLFFPAYESWNIVFEAGCGGSSPAQTSTDKELIR